MMSSMNERDDVEEVLDSEDFSTIEIDEDDTKRWQPKENTRYAFKVEDVKTNRDNKRRLVTNLRLRLTGADDDEGTIFQRLYVPKKPFNEDGSEVIDDDNGKVVEAPKTWFQWENMYKACGIDVPPPEDGKYVIQPNLFKDMEGELITGVMKSGDRKDGSGKWQNVEVKKFVSKGDEGGSKSKPAASKGKPVTKSRR